MKKLALIGRITQIALIVVVCLLCYKTQCNKPAPTQDNPKPEKTAEASPFFKPDELLTFQLKDGSYRAAICTQVRLVGAEWMYDLVMTTYTGATKATYPNMLHSFVAGKLVPSEHNTDSLLAMQPTIGEIWKYAGKRNLLFTLRYHAVAHNELATFKDKFEVTGKLPVKDSFKKQVSYSREYSFKDFEEVFTDTDSYMKLLEEQKYPVHLICQTGDYCGG
ncbi:hypothetical protein [Filimonas lacunae]|nr:hypothetical protein [Filimonas lacunae]BAV05580.1 hypothetical protein FLA_1587 [Filimonas lacunae]